MHVKLGTTIYLDFITSDVTGAAADADSTPTFEVFENDTDTALTLSGSAIAKRTGKTGDYRITLPATEANGFEEGKSYNVVASATIGGIAAKGAVARFICGPIEADVATVGGLPVGATVTPGAFLSRVTVMDGSVMNIVRGDAPTIELLAPEGWDFTGKKVYFAMKIAKDGASYIANVEATVTGARTATVTLTTTHTANAGKYWAEFEQRESDDTAPLTVQQFRLIVLQDVRQ